MEIIQLINSVGFPITAFLLMFWQSTKTIKENTKAISDLSNAIKQLK
jgi:hypothetical protein